VFPKDFGENAGKSLFAPARIGTNRTKPNITLHIDPSQPMMAGIMQGLLSRYAMQEIFSQQLASPTALKTARDALETLNTSGDNAMSAAARADLLNMFEAIAKVTQVANPNNTPASTNAAEDSTSSPISFSLPFTSSTVEVTAKRDGTPTRYNSYAHSFSGMGVQFILFMGIEFGIGLLLMQRTGMWKRLRVAPINRFDVIGSRLIAGAIIGFGFMTAIYAVGMAVFGVRVEGSWPGFVLMLIAFAFLNASIGLMIAAIGQSPEAAKSLSTYVMLVLVMLGGAWVPSFVFPQWLQTISHATPTYWAIEGFAAMTWRGQDFSAAIFPLMSVTGFAVLFTAIALWRFRWDE
jgi:ABC-2 type transport system permease protein